MDRWIQDYVKGLSSAEYQLQLSLLFIFLCFILYKAYKTHHRYRFINDTATSRVASAPQGYVELKGLGELMPGSNIESPFSHRRCLWYQCIVERRKSLEKYSVWVEESNDISDHLFQLQDETGVCVVIPDGAHIIPSEQRVWYGSHYQAKHQGIFKSWRFGRYIGFGRYRFTEKLIGVADPLYVIGAFKTIQKNVSNELIQHQVEALVQTWKLQPQRYLTAFDTNQNGKIQDGEWKRIRQHAEKEIRKQQNETVHHTIQKPRENHHPFIISAQTEEQLLKKKRGYLLLYLALFLVLLYVLLTAIKMY